MQKSIFMASTFSALALGVIYNQIRQITGLELIPLLYIAIVLLAFGLYKGLRENNKMDKKEGA